MTYGTTKDEKKRHLLRTVTTPQKVVSEYAYTTGTVGSLKQEHTYEYTNANWKDQLKKYDSVTIGYDDIGNVTDDGQWEYT